MDFRDHARRRRRIVVAGPLALFANGLRQDLAGQGYALDTVTDHVHLLADLSGWLRRASSSGRLLRPGPVPGQALYRDPAAHRAGHGRPRDLRDHRRPAHGPHRRPAPASGRPGPGTTRRSRPHPAHRPRDQATARRRTSASATARPRRPLAPMATPPPGTIPLVPQTCTPGTQLCAGQLAIGGCRTRAARQGYSHQPTDIHWISERLRRIGAVPIRDLATKIPRGNTAKGPHQLYYPAAGFIHDVRALPLIGAIEERLPTSPCWSAE